MFLGRPKPHLISPREQTMGLSHAPPSSFVQISRYPIGVSPRCQSLVGPLVFGAERLNCPAESSGMEAQSSLKPPHQ